MNGSDKRMYPRYETEIGVMIRKVNELIPAIMTDIGEGGIGIIAGRGLFPGTKVEISLKYIDDYAIHGTVKWASLVTQFDKTYYRIGIEADNILIESDGHMTETHDRSEFVKSFLPEKEK